MTDGGKPPVGPPPGPHEEEEVPKQEPIPVSPTVQLGGEGENTTSRRVTRHRGRQQQPQPSPPLYKESESEESEESEPTPSPRIKKKTVKKKSKKKPSTTGVDAPSRPRGPFIIYLEEYRKQLPSTSSGKPNSRIIMKEAGEVWKNMSDAEKQPYKALAAEESARYADQMEEYKRLHSTAAAAAAAAAAEPPLVEEEEESKGVAAASSEKTTSEEQVLNKRPRAPPRPKQAYDFYLMEQRRKHKAAVKKDPKAAKPPSDIDKLAKETWESMDESQRQPYIEKEAASKVDYAEKSKRHEKRLKRFQEQQELITKETFETTTAPKAKKDVSRAAPKQQKQPGTAAIKYRTPSLQMVPDVLLRPPAAPQRPSLVVPDLGEQQQQQQQGFMSTFYPPRPPLPFAMAAAQPVVQQLPQVQQIQQIQIQGEQSEGSSQVSPPLTVVPDNNNALQLPPDLIPIDFEELQQRGRFIPFVPYNQAVQQAPVLESYLVTLPLPSQVVDPQQAQLMGGVSSFTPAVPLHHAGQVHHRPFLSSPAPIVLPGGMPMMYTAPPTDDGAAGDVVERYTIQ